MCEQAYVHVNVSFNRYFLRQKFGWCFGHSTSPPQPLAWFLNSAQYINLSEILEGLILQKYM